MSNHPKLFDRIKQISDSTGTGSLTLNSASVGFGTFASAYADGEKLFYAITDGSNYEIGSGIFHSGVSAMSATLERGAIVSTNNNSNVNFLSGKKEVYVTYPATHSVFMGSGLAGHELPKESGLAFWKSSHILSYDSNIIWNDALNTLGIRTNNPTHALDVGGNGGQQSMIRASGYVVGPTGIHFPANNGGDSSYVGGIQYKHFLPNKLGDSNIKSIFNISGVVDEILGLKDQNKGTFFSGPPSGCTGSCSPALPSFRHITMEDLPQSVIDSSVGVDSLKNTLKVSVQDGKYSVSGVGLSGQLNPDIQLQKGLTYYFDVNAIGHPFWIKTSGSIGTEAAYNNGVLSNNNGLTNGTLKFEVPHDSPPILHYNCQYHSGMSGIIYTTSIDSQLHHHTSDASFPPKLENKRLGSVYYTDDNIYAYTSEGWKFAELNVMESQTPAPPSELSQGGSSVADIAQSVFLDSAGASVRYKPSLIKTLSASGTVLEIDVSGISNPSGITIQAQKADTSGNFTIPASSIGTIPSGSSLTKFSTTLPLIAGVFASGDTVRYRAVPTHQIALSSTNHAFTVPANNNPDFSIGIYHGGNQAFSGVYTADNLGFAYGSNLKDNRLVVEYEGNLPMLSPVDRRNFHSFQRLDASTNMNDVHQLECSQNGTLFAINAEGEMYAWGNNRYGQCANGATSQEFQSFPRQIVTVSDNSGNPYRWKKVQAGDDYIIALTTGGLVFHWGKLPDDTNSFSTRTVLTRPTLLSSTQFDQISLFNKTAAAVDTNGSLFLWGHTHPAFWPTHRVGNFFRGFLNTQSTMTPTNIPTTLTNGGNVTVADVKIGMDHILVRDGNNLYGWGSNSELQLQTSQNLDDANETIDLQEIATDCATGPNSFVAGDSATIYASTGGGMYGRGKYLDSTQDATDSIQKIYTVNGTVDQIFASKVSDSQFNTFVALQGRQCYVWGHNCGFMSYNKDSVRGKKEIQNALDGETESEYYLYDLRISNPMYVGEFLTNFDSTYKDNAVAMNRYNFMLAARKIQYSVYQNGSRANELEKNMRSPQIYAKDTNLITGDNTFSNPAFLNWGLLFCATSGTNTSSSMDWGRFRHI